MDKKRIVIVTGTGGILGTGHLQRMLNLAAHLNLTGNFSASIYLKQNEHPLDEQFSCLLTDSIPADTDLIIRDMRDSSVEEMLFLKEISKVLTIDDSGKGKESADYALNLLPLPSENNNIMPERSLFLYGYNFTEGIALLNKKDSFAKDIDVSVYAGYEPSPELLSSIKKSIPAYSVSVLLKGGKAINFTGETVLTDVPYAEIISRSKIVITHFGLTMFEADACGCKIAALNPTSYHNSLTDVISSDFNIIYSSEYSLFSPEALNKRIMNELNNSEDKIVSPSEILKKINTGTENFIFYIEKIINKEG